MSFGAPLLLVGLALVPIALAAYIVAQRRKRQYAVRYTNVDVLASVAARIGWGKHIPAAIVLLSDGANTAGQDPITVADRAKRFKIPVYTVALGTQDGYIEHTAKD